MIAFVCAVLAASSPQAAGAQLLREGRAAEALPLLQEAQQLTFQSPRIACWLAAIRAEVYAHLGDAEQALGAHLAPKVEAFMRLDLVRTPAIHGSPRLERNRA